MGLVVAMLVGLLLATIFVAAFGDSTRASSNRELSKISPFLDSGSQREESGELNFVGHRFPTWRYLGTAEREAAANEMAAHLTALGVGDGVLIGADRRVMAHWQDGELIELAPRLEE